jgi:DNA repair protein RadA/Sms
MAKDRTSFVCEACGQGYSKWQGQCTDCGAWNTLVPGQRHDLAAVAPSSAAGARAGRMASLAPASSLQSLSDIAFEETERQPTGIEEFDRVLGGGLVPGAVILLGGDPGIGKSTLLLQAMASILKLASEQSVLYVSGEESAGQLAMRAHRLGLDAAVSQQLKVLSETSLEKVLQAMEAAQPSVLVADSIQTLYTEMASGAPGSVSQVREVGYQLTQWAKRTGRAVFIVGHVTKEGALAGPRLLEHMVDTVLYFEGDAQASFRVVRAVKNRFGTVNELGVFAMTERGLKAVTNPSAMFLSEAQLSGGDTGSSHAPVSGTCVTVSLEGSRPLLVELQALVDDSQVPNPRRLAVGFDGQRLAMLLAILHRHAGIACFDQDVFVNAVGGVRIQETAADLAILVAVVSSLRNRPLAKGCVVFGEVGLTGEVRPAARGLDRLKEVARLGFHRAIVPAANAPKSGIKGMEIIGVRRLSEALAQLS